MIWWNPYCEVTNSIFEPSVVVLSLIYQSLDFILKGLLVLQLNVSWIQLECLKSSLKLSVNFFKAITCLAQRSIKRRLF